MLERFQLAAAAERRPRGIAPPERLRGSVARALLASPKLLLLDERGIGEALLRTVREAFSGPILLVTNNLDLCCAAASRLILLDAGRIVQSGPPKAVLDHPESADAARVLGIPNIFECAIAALDPARRTSRLQFSGFSIDGPHVPGHFRGDHVSIAVRPEDLRVHAGDSERRDNAVSVELVRVSSRSRTVRLEFSGGLFADVPTGEYEAKKDAKTWQVEFAPDKLTVF
jgi:molybdate transport system ATP-binding protein